MLAYSKAVLFNNASRNHNALKTQSEIKMIANGFVPATVVNKIKKILYTVI